MDKPTLYPHNQAAYEAVMRHYAEGHRKAAVIQATGTGKSYVGGAVASHFSKVLIIAPNFFVLNQASSVTPHAECRTYAWLFIQEEMPRGYDLIWLDEFHRFGAKHWQQGVEKLFEANPDAKILGTTATPERWLEKRDMAAEFFSGDVVSVLSLVDAWAKNILRVPKYIIGTVSMNDIQRDYSEKIKNAKRLSETQKIEATSRLNNIVRDWSYSYGVPRILRKYLDNNVQRMIVFAQTIYRIEETKDNIRRWFNEAGIKLANVYSVHSAMGNEAKEQMAAFEQDESDGVKVLVSVKMLIEGIHTKHVNAIMMLRSTISKNTYMQEIGRCFEVGQEQQPIIFDLADNFTSACGYQGIYHAREQYLTESGQHESKEVHLDEFIVIDTIADTRTLINALDEQVSDYDIRPMSERIAEAADWCETNGRIPLCSSKNVDDKGRVERQIYWFMDRNRAIPQVAELFAKYRRFPVYTKQEMRELSIEWCKTHNRYPLNNPKDYLQHRIRVWLHQPENAELEKSLKEQYNYQSQEEKKRIRYKEVIEFFETYGRRPRKGENAYKGWGIVVEEKGETYNHLYNKFIKPQEERTKMEKQLVIDFFEKHHRIPSFGVTVEEEESEIGRLYRKFYNDSVIAELAMKYPSKRKVKTENRERITSKYKVWLKEFISIHGYLPTKSSATGREQLTWINFYSRKSNRDEELNEIYSNTPSFIQYKFNDGINKKLIEFLTTEHRLPTGYKERYIVKLYRQYKNEQVIKDIVSTFK